MYRYTDKIEIILFLVDEWHNLLRYTIYKKWHNLDRNQWHTLLRYDWHMFERFIQFKLVADVLGNIAQMERENILERQREGIAIAKAKGDVYKGRKPGTTESKEKFLVKHKKIVQLLNSKVSIRNTAKIAEVSPQTVQKVKRYLND